MSPKNDSWPHIMESLLPLLQAQLIGGFDSSPQSFSNIIQAS